MKRYWPHITLLAIWILFFYKTIFFGLLPFPGDLLVSEYKPWSTYPVNGYGAGTYPSKVQYFDVLRQLYPWRELAIDQMKHGEFPLWNPYDFSGSPLLANGQTAAFYPLNILFFMLPFPVAWSILVMLQPLLASLFMYYYSRTISLSKISSILASIIFGYGMFTSVFLEYNIIVHTYLWLPLILASIEKFKIKFSMKDAVISVIAIVCSGLAGHLQIFAGVLGITIIYILLRKAPKQLLLLPMISLGMCAIQFFPTLELILNSARSAQPYENILNTLLLQPAQLFLFFAPDLFGNPATRNYVLDGSYAGRAVYAGIVWLLFLIPVWKNRKLNPVISVLGLIAVGIFLLITKNPINMLFYRLNIPFVSTSSPSNMVFILLFCLAILSGFGMDVWLNEKIKNYTFILPGVILLLLIIISTRFLSINIRSLYYSSGIIFILSSLVFTGIYKPDWKKYLVIPVIAILTMDFFYYFHKYNPFVPMSLIYPSTPIAHKLREISGTSRIWGYGSAHIQSNLFTHMRLYSPDGYDPLYPYWYGNLIGSSKNGILTEAFSTDTRSDAFIEPGYGQTDLADNTYRLKILQLLGVRYILDRSENGSTEKTFPPELFTHATDVDDWKIFEYKNVLPKAYIITNWQKYSSPSDFSTKFFSTLYNPSISVLLTEHPGFEPYQADSISKVVSAQKQNSFRIYTPKSAILVVNNTWYPGWKAYVDNQETRILRVNYAQQGVPVPGGEHTVTLNYDPQSFRIGATISVANLIIFAGIIILLKKKSNRI